MKQLYIYIYVLITLVILMPGCSKDDGPENLEPEITIMEASEITRTEAVISANVINHGNAPLDYILFRYGKNGEMNLTTDKITSPTGTVSVKLSGLQPGSTYSFRAEAGTSSATFSTDVLTFTTIPNDLPKVTDLTILSSGPSAVIVSFEILDDGGEPLVEAGCEFSLKDSDSPSRIMADQTVLSEGKIQLTLKGLSPSSEYIIYPFASNTAGETKGNPLSYFSGTTINLGYPGHLPDILNPQEYNSSEISISGPMDGSDFKVLRTLLGATTTSGQSPILNRNISVDISDVAITEGGLTYDNSRQTIENVITTGLFANCENLVEISLPFSATEMQRNAFSGCAKLKSITIPAGIKTLLPSSDCEALESIEVSKANEYYASVDGVLFNQDISEIVWFPSAKKGEFTMPSTVTTVKENAFRNTQITSLILPSSVTVIERGAFSGTLLQQISMPDNLTNISEGMFQDCSNLKVIKLGSATQFLGNYVFDGCPLEHIYLQAEIPPYVSTNSFTNNSSLFSTCTLHVPAGKKAVYRNHQKWKSFEKIVEI